MRRRSQHVDGFSESLAKVRKAVHKIFPRELSPTRLAEKYGADQKKKAAKKLASVSIESNARNAAADQVLERQLATIRATLPGTIGPLPLAMSAPKTPPSVRASSPNYVPALIGAAALAGAALLFFGGKRR